MDTRNRHGRSAGVILTPGGALLLKEIIGAAHWLDGRLDYLISRRNDAIACYRGPQKAGHREVLLPDLRRFAAERGFDLNGLIGVEYHRLRGQDGLLRVAVRPITTFFPEWNTLPRCVRRCAAGRFFGPSQLIPNTEFF